MIGGGNRALRQAAGRAWALAAVLLTLAVVALGAVVLWRATRPPRANPAALAVARQGLVWASRLGQGGSPTIPPWVVPGSQAALWGRYVAAAETAVPGVRLIRSRLADVQIVRQLWTAAHGYAEFRVADRRWFRVAGWPHEVEATSRALVTLYLERAPAGRWRVSAVALLPSLPGAGSPATPSLYPDEFTTAGNNPLGG